MKYSQIVVVSRMTTLAGLGSYSMGTKKLFTKIFSEEFKSRLPY